MRFALLGGSGTSVGLLAMAMTLPAMAQVSIEVLDEDPEERGFHDPRNVEPVPGNSATQLGEQRWNAVQHAVRTAGAALDGVVPLEVRARFAPEPALPCTSTEFVAARGQAAAMARIGSYLYPSALAATLSSDEQLASEPVGSLLFNGALDGSSDSVSSCSATAAWDYRVPEVDGSVAEENGSGSRPRIALHSVVQHELLHVLGLTTNLDFTRSLPEYPSGAPDVYSSFVYSHGFDALLSELDAEERLQALTTPKDLVWTGGFARRAAAAELARGVPSVWVRREEGASWVNAGEDVAEVLPATAFDSVSGQAALLSSGEVCSGSGADESAIWVVDAGGCSIEDKLFLAAEGGARALLVESDASPARTHSLGSDAVVPLPAVVVGEPVFSGLVESVLAGAEVLVQWDGARLIGADPAGRPYLFTPKQLNPGSTLTHLDPLARLASSDRVPLMVPDADRLSLGATGVLAFAMLKDLGWGAPACGNGRRDGAEPCDEGEQNSDVQPDACRRDCTLPRCGDAVVDEGEECDHGELNDDQAPDACRLDCTLPRCGDGVLSRRREERCDDGRNNSDLLPDRCRTTCLPAHCGDAVTDSDEACDDGAENSDTAPDRCRLNCTEPRCGDGIVDTEFGEECDDGNTLAGPRCTATCQRPDTGDTQAPVSFDAGTIRDAGTKVFDDTADARADARVTAGEKGPRASDATSAGCACQTASRSPSSGWFWALAGALWGARRRRTTPNATAA